MVNVTENELKCMKATKPVADPTVLGIDPGQTGAVALIHARRLSVYDYTGPEDAVKLIAHLKGKYNPVFAMIEKQWIWNLKYERNVKTAEKLIRSAQMWETLMYVNKIPFTTIPAVQWRKDFVPEKYQNKKGYIAFANTIFKDSIHIFSRHDRAEAALIAHRAYFRVKK